MHAKPISPTPLIILPGYRSEGSCARTPTLSQNIRALDHVVQPLPSAETAARRFRQTALERYVSTNFRPISYINRHLLDLPVEALETICKMNVPLTDRSSPRLVEHDRSLRESQPDAVLLLVRRLSGKSRRDCLARIMKDPNTPARISSLIPELLLSGGTDLYPEAPADLLALVRDREIDPAIWGRSNYNPPSYFEYKLTPDLFYYLCTTADELSLRVEAAVELCSRGDFCPDILLCLVEDSSIDQIFRQVALEGYA